MVSALHVVQSPDSAAALFHPERRRVLELLREPDSAAGLARKLEMPRQTVNYHLKMLEQGGLVEFVEQRLKGNCAERLMRAKAAAFVVSQAALGDLGVSPESFRDQYSAAYLVNAASTAIRDIAHCRERANRAGKRIATLTIETDIRFASAESRNEFTQELSALVARLAAKYNDTRSPNGRPFRLLVGAYPKLAKQEPPQEAGVRME